MNVKLGKSFNQFISVSLFFSGAFNPINYKLRNLSEVVPRKSPARFLSTTFSFSLSTRSSSMTLLQNINQDYTFLLCLQSALSIFIHQKTILTCSQSSLSLMPSHRKTRSSWNVSPSTTGTRATTVSFPVSLPVR